MEEHSAQQSVWRKDSTQHFNQVVFKNVNVNIWFYINGIFEDYTCTERKSSTIITVERGDYLTYNTNPGGAAE